MSAKVSLSPIQVKQLLFTKVLVEPCAFDEDQNVWAPTFDFSDTAIQTEIMTGIQDGEEDDPKHFLTSLRVSMLNDNPEKVSAPYTVDVKAQALIELEPVFDVKKRRSIVSVNGSVVLLGAIRELVSQLTARSNYGPMTLPTLRFDVEGQKG